MNRPLRGRKNLDFLPQIGLNSIYGLDIRGIRDGDLDDILVFFNRDEIRPVKKLHRKRLNQITAQRVGREIDIRHMVSLCDFLSLLFFREDGFFQFFFL